MADGIFVIYFGKVQIAGGISGSSGVFAGGSIGDSSIGRSTCTTVQFLALVARRTCPPLWC